MQKLTFKKIIRQLHLILGLASGLVVFIVAITGSLYVFEEEGRALFQHDFYHVQQPGTERVAFSRMMDTVKAHYPKDKITRISFKETKDAAIIFYSKKDRAISVNPYNATIITSRNENRDFFTVDQEIHTHLLMGEVGATIIKCNVLIFFFMCISGLVLWWPKQKRFFKRAITISFKTKNWKLLNWELHSVLGFYALIVLLIISLTGIFFAYDSAKSTLAFLTGQPVPKKEKKLKSKPVAGKHFSIDDAYHYMTVNNPGATETFFTPPADSIAPINVRMRYPYTLVRKQTTVLFNQYTGKVLKAERYQDYTAYDNVSKSNYDFHTGRIRVLGIGSKIIYFLSGLTAASLPVTGFLIWLGKKRKQKKGVKKARVVTA